MTTAIAITGIGLVTPAGADRDATWHSIRAGIPTAAHDPDLVGLPVTFSCRVKLPEGSAGLPKDIDRATRFALTAGQEAIHDAGLASDEWPSDRVAVVMGSAVGGVTTYDRQLARLLEAGPRAVSALLMPTYLSNMIPAQLALAFDIRGPSQHVSTACASGGTAIATAVALLRDGKCDIALAGGAEAGVTPLIVSTFARMRALSTRHDRPDAASRPFDRERDGFVMSEGAAVLVLERQEDAAARGRAGYALILGCGSSSDAHHVVAPHPDGAGAERAIREALRDCDAATGDVDHVNAHGTSTRQGDAVEAQTINRLLGTRPSVTSAKGVTGHMFGAAGAAEAAFTALSIADGIIPPVANLVEPDPRFDIDLVAGNEKPQRIRLALTSSFGFGGQNVVLALGPVS